MLFGNTHMFEASSTLDELASVFVFGLKTALLAVQGK